MFGNKSGWFSSSVPQTCCNIWMIEGGILANWRTADYLFSDDATCPDTLRIFKSKDYLWNKVTVFHSMFLLACEKRGSVNSVSIGHYVLPPAPVQDEVRNVVGRLIWECDDAQPITQTCCACVNFQTKDACIGAEAGTSNYQALNADTSVRQDFKNCEFEDYTVSSLLTGYVTMSNLQKYSGDLYDYQPSCPRGYDHTLVSDFFH